MTLDNIEGVIFPTACPTFAIVFATVPYFSLSLSNCIFISLIGSEILLFAFNNSSLIFGDIFPTNSDKTPSLLL